MAISTLKEGDAIIAATADGKITNDTISVLSITKPEAKATFISVLTSTSKMLNLTAGHHIPVGDACCTTLKQAKDLAIGDIVYTAVGEKMVAVTVLKVSTAVHKGLHSPVLTAGSFPIVDGIVTSFDTMAKVTLAAYGLPTLVKACKLTGTCDLLRNAIAH